MIPIGLLMTLIGLIGLGYELLKPSEEEVFEELIINYDDEVGFAPFFAEDPGLSETPTDLPGSSSQSGATATPDPSVAQAILGWVPDNLQIPSIHLDAPIVPVDYVDAELHGVSFTLWLAPRGYRVGWHATSALLGVGGNTVLNGHHNAYEMVFEHLIDVEEGDQVIVSSGENHFYYTVTTKVIFPERFETFETRIENTSWIEPTDDERITMVTCWPAASNTHRLVVVAEPDPTAESNP
jgi:LPXTG-site transpeptidase (sortase) family protein